MTTGTVELPSEYSHVSWDVSGLVTPRAVDCAPSLCGGSESCGCVYRRGSNYTHHVCLSPGRHALTIHDAMGFGWLGARLSLHYKGHVAADAVALSDGERAIVEQLARHALHTAACHVTANLAWRFAHKLGALVALVVHNLRN